MLLKVLSFRLVWLTSAFWRGVHSDYYLSITVIESNVKFTLLDRMVTAKSLLASLFMLPPTLKLFFVYADAADNSLPVHQLFVLAAV